MISVVDSISKRKEKLVRSQVIGDMINLNDFEP